MTTGEWLDDPQVTQDIWEGLGEAVLLLDTDSTIRAANAQASRLSQYSRKELLGMSMGVLVPDPDLLMARQMRLTLRRGGRYVANIPWRRKDGTTVLVEMTGTPVDMRGQPLALVLCRESFAAQESEAQLRAQLAQLEDLYLASALMITDLTVPQLLNNIAAQVCEMTAATASGIFLHDRERDVLVLEAVHGVPAEGLGTALARDEGLSWRCFTTRRSISTSRYAGLPYALDLESRFSFGSDRYQHIPVLAVPLLWQDQALGVLTLGEPDQGRPFGAVDEYIVRLLANQVSMALNQSWLYDELRASNEALQGANTLLRELDQMKDDFLSMVSHELQQPLATARLGVDLVLQQRETLGEQQVALLERALRSIDTQNLLIRDLLYLVDLRKPGDQFRDVVDLGAVVRAVHDAMLPEAEAKGLQVNLDIGSEPVMCQVAALGLERVVDHLLGNAIKFTPKGSISISVRRDDADGEGILAIADSGIGISKEQQRRIFESFYQVEGSSTRAYDGLGLGLALVSRITDLYGGRISVQSQEGAGSLFSLTFPLVP